jgi:hypothetical protein
VPCRVEAPAPLLLALLDGGALRLPFREQRRQLAGKGARLLEKGAAIERSNHMQAARTGGLHVRGELDFPEQFPECARGVADRPDVAPGRIEVEDQLIGVVELVDPREPDVRRDAGLVCQVDERLGVLDHDVLDAAAALALHACPRDEVGEVVGRQPLLDLLALDPVREALHVHRPAANVRQHRLGDPLVVARELGLG